MNVLFFAYPADPHDQKLILYLNRQIDFRIHILTSVTQMEIMTEKELSFLKQQDIILLDPIDVFSVTNIIRTYRIGKIIRKIITNYQIDLVHILYTAPNALWSKYFDKTPYILTSRGSDVLITLKQIQKSRFNFSYLLNKFLWKGFKNAFTNAAAVTSTSYGQAAVITQLFGLSSNVIRTGVDITNIRLEAKRQQLPKSLNNEEYIFFPRHLKPVYNHELEIAAIKLLPPTIKSEFVFVFIRDYSESDTSYNEFIETQLRSIPDIRILIFDFLPKPTFLSVLLNSNLVVMVPHSDGTPVSAIEAMVFEKPLIMGSFAYDSDIFTNSCMRMKGIDPAELANLVQTGLSSYPKQYIINAKKNAEKFADSQKEHAKMKALYDTILIKPKS